MKYIILADSDNVEPFIEPRQLSKVNGERLVERTVRLLKENGIKDILITSHDPRFNIKGATRYEPQHNSYNGKQQKGYWLDAFTVELLNEPVTFLLGDVYFSEKAIKTIVESKTETTLFFCTDKTKGYSEKYIKKHDEPLAYKVVDFELFKKHIDRVKRMWDKRQTHRHPIIWELYRSINNINVNEHRLTTNYIPINDETCDIDRLEDIYLLELKTGGNKMIRVKVTEDFDYGSEKDNFKKFHELKELIRADGMNDKEGHLYIGDMFLCDKDTAEYLTGKNKYNRAFVEIIEVIPEKKEEKTKKTTKRKTKKKEV